MSLYDRLMRATDDPATVLRVNTAAQGAARLATDYGHPALAAGAAAATALFAAVDTVMHTPNVAPGTYAGFKGDK